MTAPRRRGLVAVIGCLVIVFMAFEASAASRLPWTDANPLERLFGKPRHAPAHRSMRHKPKHSRPAPAPSAAAAAEKPIVAGVPVPDPRPETARQPESPAADPKPVPPAGDAAKDGDGRSPAGPADKSAPTSDADAPKRENAASGPDGPPAPSAGTPGKDKSEPEAPVAIPPPKPDASADPAAAATLPVATIPVPIERPDKTGDRPDEPPAKTAPERPTADEGKADDAPNSTEKLKSRIATISPAAAVLAAAAVADARLCEAELTKRGVTFTVGESLSEGECGVLRPVNVSRLSSGVKVSPDTQFLCRTALALDEWMTRGVLPAVKADLDGRALLEFRHASTYVCRPRASESGISEHARGSAIDIARFVFDKGEDIGVAFQAEGSPEAKFQADIRSAACGPFKTVLGPGTDPDHATHFHLDIAARKNGATYCK